MAHYSKLDENNIVIEVIVINNENELDENGILNEAVGVEYCKNVTGHENWKKTSYNTYRGGHPNGLPFRKNFGQIGYTYDPIRDAFIEPKPHSSLVSWILDEDGCYYKPPKKHPNNGYSYQWDESTTSWINPVKLNDWHIEYGDPERPDDYINY